MTTSKYNGHKKLFYDFYFISRNNDEEDQEKDDKKSV